MTRIALAACAMLCAAVLTPTAAAQSRDQIRITGSSTLYPFSTAVSEEFGRTTSFDAPIVEGIGSGGGLKQFCSGLGTSYPDIANASRRIKASEYDLCQSNGVTDIVEIKIGYDGIVLANTKEAPQLTLSLSDIYLALAASVPVQGSQGGVGLMVANPYRLWSDIRPDLPAVAITVLGPPPTSGTRDAFNELALEGGCQQFEGLRRLKLSDPDLHQRLCQSIREDGAFIESGENDNLIVQKLQANWDAVGIFGFSFLDQNSDVLQPVKVTTPSKDAVPPTFDTIADGAYPIFRSLYFYVKKAHVGVIPGIPEYLNAFTDDEAWGEFGYLIDRGLIPLTPVERQRYSQIAVTLTPMQRP